MPNPRNATPSRHALTRGRTNTKVPSGPAKRRRKSTDCASSNWQNKQTCGSVDVTHTTNIATSREWRRLAPQHKIGSASDPTQVAPYPDVAQHAWHLSSPKRFQPPIKTVLTRGPVTFQKFLPPSSLPRPTTLLVNPRTSPAPPPHIRSQHPGQPPCNPRVRLPPAARARTTCAVLVHGFT